MATHYDRHATPVTILRINQYASRHHHNKYNYRDTHVHPNERICIVEFKGQKSGQQDKHILPGAYVVTHATPNSPLALLGRVRQVMVVSPRTDTAPAVYKLMVHRVRNGFRGFHASPPFVKSSAWKNRQRHLANLLVQWFDVDPAGEVYLMSGYAKGVVRKAFANGFVHPPLAM
jgi:hypothetical protein